MGGIETGGKQGESRADRSRWVALYVVMLLIVLDGTVVNVALPAIQEDLGFSQAGLAWVMNAYLISFGGLLLLARRLGDLISPDMHRQFSPSRSTRITTARPPDAPLRRWTTS